jgi:predicted glycosyltransferase
MKILFDLLHPAHVHVFKNVIAELQKNGHQVIVTSREKDHTVFLLDKYGIKHTCLSKIAKNKVGLLVEFLVRAFKLMVICRREKPDLMVGIMGAIIAPVGKLMGIPSHTYYDTEIAKLTNQYVYKLTTKFITPNCYTDAVPPAIHVQYNGYHELAYLHPNRFTPDAKVLNELGLKEGDTFFVMRFVSWEASHDIGQKGLSLENKRRLIEFLEPIGKIIITSENELPQEFERFRMTISPEKMHDVLYYTALFVGEGATMASECAMLGTPAIYINSLNLGYIQDLERLGLIFSFRNDEKVFDFIKELVTSNGINKTEWQKKAKQLLADKIDLTEFMMKMMLQAGKS